jgi:hypothetical protein
MALVPTAGSKGSAKSHGRSVRGLPRSLALLWRKYLLRLLDRLAEAPELGKVAAERVSGLD